MKEDEGGWRREEEGDEKIVNFCNFDVLKLKAFPLELL